MLILEHPGGELKLRLTRQHLESALAREAASTPAGQLVVIGDGGWDPATLTLRFRVTSADVTTPGEGALAAVAAVTEAALSATAIRLAPAGNAPNAVTYLHGARRVQRRPRGTWWEIEVTFLPRGLRGVSGTGELVTVAGARLRAAGRLVHLEVP